MRHAVFAILAGVTAGTAAAQGIRSDDKILGANETLAALSGQVVTFFDGSTATYHDDGSYEYAYRPEDPPFRGTFVASEGGEVCVTFDNGFDRCDVYVMAGGRLVLVIDEGTRFPVKTVAPIVE